MGFSLSAAAAVLFVAGFFSLSMLLGAYIDMQSSIAEAGHDAIYLIEKERRERIEILLINESGEIRLINSGAEVMKVDSVVVFVNGSAANDLIENIEVAGKTESKLWAPGEVLIIRMRIGLNESKVFVVAGLFGRAYGG